MIPVSGERPEVRIPFVTIALVAACVWAFVVIQPSAQERERLGPSDELQSFVVGYAAVPCEVLRGEPLSEREYQAVFVEQRTTECASGLVGEPAQPNKHIYLALLYSMFLHAGWIHLIGNMLSLWVFGAGVEITIGRALYAALYIFGGMVATIGYVISESNSAIPIVGASGAIAAVMGAYLVLYPLSTIRVWLLVLVPMPAIVFLVVWFAFQFTFGEDSAVAWMAHVTGFIAGVLAASVWRLRAKRLSRSFAPDRVE